MLGWCLALEFGGWDWVWNLGGGGGGGRAWMATVRQRHARHRNLDGFSKGTITANSKYPALPIRIERYLIRTVPEQPRSTPP